MFYVLKVFWDNYVNSIFPVLLRTILLKEADSRWYFYSKFFSILNVNVENIVSHKALRICNCALLLLYCRICSRNWTKWRFKLIFTFLSANLREREYFSLVPRAELCPNELSAGKIALCASV